MSEVCISAIWCHLCPHLSSLQYGVVVVVLLCIQYGGVVNVFGPSDPPPLLHRGCQRSAHARTRSQRTRDIRSQQLEAGEEEKRGRGGKGDILGSAILFCSLNCCIMPDARWLERKKLIGTLKYESGYMFVCIFICTYINVNMSTYMCVYIYVYEYRYV